MKFECDGRVIEPDISRLIIAGWTGKDEAERNRHIHELEELGVSAPETVPAFYPAGTNLLTQEASIQVAGQMTSGEAEAILYFDQNELYVGVGSDHTDRKAEKLEVLLSKQCCPKPISREVWRYSDVKPHWNRLILQSHILLDNTKVLYQEGSIASLMSPTELLANYEQFFSTGTDNLALFMGTVPMKAGIDYASFFSVSLVDPVLKRRLTHQYRIFNVLNQE
ncbi:DUF2848 domain-containing protein [Vibrio maritimus]|uniref:DUF2848 domain-containing protein n=1 Tax=Vibrio maritimus TaxID=990268 RepID=UPI001F241B69|nr:DUF2848 domain-containing protein [Vibrio maritimus]